MISRRMTFLSALGFLLPKVAQAEQERKINPEVFITMFNHNLDKSKHKYWYGNPERFVSGRSSYAILDSSSTFNYKGLSLTYYKTWGYTVPYPDGTTTQHFWDVNEHQLLEVCKQTEDMILSQGAYAI